LEKGCNYISKNTFTQSEEVIFASDFYQSGLSDVNIQAEDNFEIMNGS
jgi:hypothetical protein